MLFDCLLLLYKVFNKYKTLFLDYLYVGYSVLSRAIINLVHVQKVLAWCGWCSW